MVETSSGAFAATELFRRVFLIVFAAGSAAFKIPGSCACFSEDYGAYTWGFIFIVYAAKYTGECRTALEI